MEGTLRTVSAAHTGCGPSSVLSLCLPQPPLYPAHTGPSPPDHLGVRVGTDLLCLKSQVVNVPASHPEQANADLGEQAEPAENSPDFSCFDECVFMI